MIINPKIEFTNKDDKTYINLEFENEITCFNFPNILLDTLHIESDSNPYSETKDYTQKISFIIEPISDEIHSVWLERRKDLNLKQAEEILGCKIILK